MEGHTLFQQQEEESRSAHDVHGVGLVVPDAWLPRLEEFLVVIRVDDGQGEHAAKEGCLGVFGAVVPGGSRIYHTV